MNIWLVLCCMQFILALSATEPGTAIDLEEWNKFKVTYGKTYRSKEVEEQRMKIFLENKKRIEEHNQDYKQRLVSFTTGINKFSDLTSGEFNKMRGYSSLLTRRPASRNFHVLLGRANLPRSLDWRSKGAVTGVKDQERCLACWVFSAVGAVESQHFLKTGQLVSLSEQNVVDCLAAPEDDENCPIGWMDTAFEYIQDHGVDTEESYPFEGKVADCRFNDSTIGATISGYTDLPPGDESALRKAVALVGPVAVAIDSKHGDFMHYKSGVFFSEECKNSEADLDHAVIVVGYGKEDGLAYWLVKNSWGTSWGEGGFGKIARNKENHCGIATKASYPNID